MESVCPVCLERVDARELHEDGCVFMEKTCPSHGEFRTLLWRGPGYARWNRPHPAVELPRRHTASRRGCPRDCGLCPAHRQRSCCVLLELTPRCNLRCPVCFAAAGEGGPDPGLAEIGGWYDLLMDSGGPFNIQLSGGEPTMRDDLPQIIRLGREKGFSFFQLNTNGLRLAREPGYAQTLRDAGLDCVFLQFDSLRDEVFRRLRGRALLREKLAAIDQCGRAGLGVVLAPTVAPGVNEADVGEILRFAVERLPVVRGVHFQPLSYFGRYPGDPCQRVTLPDMLRLIEEQTGGQMRGADFHPGGAEHPLCSFRCSYLLRPDGTLKAYEQQPSACCCGDADNSNSSDAGNKTPATQKSGSARWVQAQPGADKSREFVAGHWSAAPLSSGDVSRDSVPGSFDEFIRRTRSYTLAVSGMVFQDAWNLDLDRLRSCYIHVVSPDRRMIPFCAYNLTARDGRALHRGTGR